MEKEPKRLILRATPFICLLSLILLYSDFRNSTYIHFDHWKEQYWSTGICITSNKVVEKTDKHELQITNREIDRKTDKREFELTRTEHDKTVERKESQLTSREWNRTSHDHESELSNGVINKAEMELETRFRSPGGDRRVKEHESFLSNGEVNKKGVADESQLNNREDDGRIDRHETLHSDKEVNRTTDESRSEQSSKEMNKTEKTLEYQVSNKEFKATTDEKAFKLLIRDLNETVGQQKQMESPLARLVRGEDRTKLETTGFACDRAEHSVVCVADKPVSIDTKTMTVYVPSRQPGEHKKTKVRPYARQEDDDLLQSITSVQILQGNANPPPCLYTHNVSAVIFSTSGFAGNLFHEFNEIIIPLYLTTLHLRTQALFILLDYKPSFVNKYWKVMSRLSAHELMNPDKNRTVHCFSGAVVGLKFHDNLALNSSDIPGGLSMPDFRQFLRKAYNLKITNVSEIERPIVMLMSRLGTRRFLNEGEMVAMMKQLGFKVIVVRKPDQMSNLNKFSRLVNRCSVLVGAHGAGLANELFLPTGGVMVQVEPIGLIWGSAVYYGNPAAAMGVHYLRYKISKEESSLITKYGRNHPVVADPGSIWDRGYQAARAVYLDQQNMKVNISRFRETLTEALRLIGRSAP